MINRYTALLRLTRSKPIHWPAFRLGNSGTTMSRAPGTFVTTGAAAATVTAAAAAAVVEYSHYIYRTLTRTACTALVSLISIITQSGFKKCLKFLQVNVKSWIQKRKWFFTKARELHKWIGQTAKVCQTVYKVVVSRFVINLKAMMNHCLQK